MTMLKLQDIVISCISNNAHYQLAFKFLSNALTFMVLHVLDDASFRLKKKLGEMPFFVPGQPCVACQILYSIMISTLCYEHQTPL
jgi:hypothetical protein